MNTGMNTERTISIRKRVHISEGIVRERARPGYAVDGEPFNATDITCTITVDVPVLTEQPSGGLYREETIAWLHEHGLGPDDEIGLLAGAVPVGGRFRRHNDTDSVGYQRPALHLYDFLYGPVARGEQMLGIDANGRALRTEVDTPVVVRVRDILPGYQPLEDK